MSASPTTLRLLNVFAALLLVCGCGARQRPDGGSGPLLRGNAVSALAALDQHGQPVRVGGNTQELSVVYFYPKDGTPGCTAEACAFRDVWQQYQASNVRVIGVSNDDRDSHAEFAKTEHLPFSLVADTDDVWAKAFGVASFAGFYARVTFLVGANGVVLETYDDVDPGLHAKEILRDVQRHRGSDPLAPAPSIARPDAPSVHFQLRSGDVVVTRDGTYQFWLGATLTPPTGSHLYWQYSGEVGLPTHVQFTAPRELHVEEAQYPGPTRFTTERGQVAYGYEGPVTIVARVTSASRITDAVIHAYGTWLSCDVRCVKEQGAATLTWNGAASAPPLDDIDATLVRLAKPGNTIGLTARFDASAGLVRVESTDAGLEVVEIFPEQHLAPDDRAPERYTATTNTATTNTATTNTATWKWHTAAEPKTLTVLTAKEGHTSYYRVLR